MDEEEVLSMRGRRMVVEVKWEVLEEVSLGPNIDTQRIYPALGEHQAKAPNTRS